MKAIIIDDERKVRNVLKNLKKENSPKIITVFEKNIL